MTASCGLLEASCQQRTTCSGRDRRVACSGRPTADCQQRAGLRSLRSLRPLPTSTASPLRANLYPSGPSPCPCPRVDTPARRRIPLSPGPGRLTPFPCANQPILPPALARHPPSGCKTALPAHGIGPSPPPVCKSALPVHSTSPSPSPVCKSALPAPGTSPSPPPGCKSALPAHGIGQSPPPGCKSALPAHGTVPPSTPGGKTALPAHGPGQCRQVECVTEKKENHIQQQN